MSGTAKTRTKELIEQHVKTIVSNLIQPYIERLAENIRRVISLITLYQKTKGNKELISDPDDIFRSAVVLLHASLEDFMRVLSAAILPTKGNEQLSSIPLVGKHDGTRPEKFSLAELAKHRGKTVDAVISESVNSYLEKTSYNAITDVENTLRIMGIRPKDVKTHYSDLEEMMKRRHQIVHRADRTANIKGKELICGIDESKVINWVSSVIEFMQKVLLTYAVDESVNKIMKELERNIPKEA